MKTPLDIPVIDCHIHAYPADIGERTRVAMHGTEVGTIENLLGHLRNVSTNKASGALLKNMTPSAEMAKAAWDRAESPLRGRDEERNMYASVQGMIAGRLRRRNAWGTEMYKKHPTLLNFFAVDPNMLTPEENVEELELRVKEGAKGIAMHPTRNLHRPDDRRLFPTYDRAQELGLTLLTHTGTEGFRPAYMALNSEPFDFKGVMDNFPKLKVILCHMGNGFLDQTVEMGRLYPDFLIETSGPISPLVPATATRPATPPRYSDEEVVKVLRSVGLKRVVFGSDWVFGNIEGCVQHILSLPLTDKEKEGIFYRNITEYLDL